MEIKLNGVDWTNKLNPYSVRSYHKKVEGGNGGTSMGGLTLLDIVAVKAGLKITAGLLTQADHNALMLLAKNDYITVTYTDPDTNQSVTRAMILTTGEAKQLPLLGGGYMYKNVECDFLER